VMRIFETFCHEGAAFGLIAFKEQRLELYHARKSLGIATRVNSLISCQLS